MRDRNRMGAPETSGEWLRDFDRNFRAPIGSIEIANLVCGPKPWALRSRLATGVQQQEKKVFAVCDLRPGSGSIRVLVTPRIRPRPRRFSPNLLLLILTSGHNPTKYLCIKKGPHLLRCFFLSGRGDFPFRPDLPSEARLSLRRNEDPPSVWRTNPSNEKTQLFAESFVGAGGFELPTSWSRT